MIEGSGVTLELGEIVEAVSGDGAGLSGEVSGYSIDSRSAQRGDLFFAIRGEQHDGHSFVPEVLSKGAAAAVVCRQYDGRDSRLIRVRDTLLALQELAAYARMRWGGTIIGVTGSAGKTTTKDVIASMLATAMPVGKTMGNFNNHIGLPLSVLGIPAGAEAAVLEYGMNHAGEIRNLASIAKPDIAVVTNVGYAHIEAFEDLEGVALAKRELVEALPESGTAVLNADDPRVRRFAEIHPGRSVFFGLSEYAGVRAEDIEPGEDGIRFRVGDVRFESSLIGRPAVRNILAGIAVAQLFGMDPGSLCEAVRSLAPGKMRGERLAHNGVKIINDSYNSNPDAARSMLDVLRDIPARRHIAVLGEMLELGRWSEPLHRDVGRYAATCGTSVLVGIRGGARSMVDAAVEAGLPKNAAYFFDDPDEAGRFLRDVAQPGDAILFKGSRGTRVEKALERFLG
jgi:UDP-N-acetylmuramoyl-tripeptide--D-alanyl-D-alanine ligase